MKILKPVVVSLATLSLITETRPHVDVNGFEPEPEPRAPFNVVMTATAAAVTMIGPGHWNQFE